MHAASFQGDIASLALADVVQNLATNKKSGTLVVRHGPDDVRHILFSEGIVVGYGDQSDFSLARWLTDKEILTPEELQGAAKRYRRAKRKTLSSILADLGLLGAEESVAYLKDIVTDAIYEVLSFEEGAFEFVEGQLLDDLIDRDVKAIGLRLSPSNLIMEAARRMDDWQNVRRCIPSENEIYHVASSTRARMAESEVDDITRETADLLDGTRTVRQVIAKLPYSRFDACRAIALLVSEKKARPLDGNRAMAQRGNSASPKDEIACLKAILEREPGNREILGRLASLEEEAGDPKQSCTYYKLLAMAHAEDGDQLQAEEFLRRALQHNRRDLATWNRLWEIVCKQGDAERILASGREAVAHFRKIGLTEIARDRLAELTRMFPAAVDLKLELADARFALGDKEGCLQDLFEIAREHLRTKRLDEAANVFDVILKYDQKNRKARENLQKIRSGQLARRRLARKRVTRAVLSSLLLGALVAYFAYDVVVRVQLAEALRVMVHESVLAERRYDDALLRLRKLQDRHPYSLTTYLETDRIFEALRDEKARAERAAGAQVLED